MNIYIPFTYIIGWTKHKKFYYGAKYSQGCQPSDLWQSYFTSSKYVKEFREQNGEPDIIKIHRTFSNKDSCVEFENQYLTTIDAKNNPLFINEHNGGKGFDAGGKVCVKDCYGNTFQVSTDEPKYISGELSYIFSGNISVKDKNGNNFSVAKDDPRYLSGELIPINKNKIVVKDNENNIFSVTKDDPRYLSGELISIHKGKIIVKDKEGKCFKVSKEDPRYLSGELVGIRKK